jgi:CRISPR-associated protein Cas5t
MMLLYLEAPFAACRTFTAGWYRPTATFLTPSAAYGILLNVAGIETRLREEDAEHPGRVPASLMRPGLPPARLALGVPAFRVSRGKPIDEAAAPFPRVQTIYQQLHNYPVGSDAGVDPALTRGSKNNISPVRREFLSELRALIGLDGNPELEDRVRRGLRGELNGSRYGVLFLGDNQYMPDRLEEITREPPQAWQDARVWWYQRLGGGESDGPRPRTTRMTTWIDRADLSQTRSSLYAPGEACPLLDPLPESAWTAIDPPTSPVKPTRPGRRQTP